MKPLFFILLVAALVACSKAPDTKPNNGGTTPPRDTTTQPPKDTTTQPPKDTTTQPPKDTAKTYTIRALVVEGVLLVTSGDRAAIVLGDGAGGDYLELNTEKSHNISVALKNAQDSNFSVTAVGNGDFVAHYKNIKKGTARQTAPVSDTAQNFIYLKVTGFDEKKDGFSELNIYMTDDRTPDAGTYLVRGFATAPTNDDVIKAFAKKFGVVAIQFQ